MTEAARAVADGLFVTDGENAVLLGARCEGCGAVYFPRPLSCRNPACHEKRLTAVELPGEGTLISYTVQRYRPPPLFRMDDWAPYAIGLVSLGDRIEVMGMLSGFELDHIAIGSPVRVICAPLYTDDAGAPVHTYQFAPAPGR